MTILRQRDEAQRVVLHLRSLIGGQAHHMEHLVRSLNQTPELTDYVEGGYEDVDDLEDIAEESKGSEVTSYHAPSPPRGHAGSTRSQRYSSSGVQDVADRQLRDKTDAIAHIIRNISEQCAAAVEGLQLAHDADTEAEEMAHLRASKKRESQLSTTSVSDDGHSMPSSDVGEDSLLHPSGRTSSIPPTPDLVHHRSSTAMSMASSVTTATPERGSQQYNLNDMPTKIVEDSDEEARTHEHEAMSEMVTKATLLHRPAGARISALGAR